MHTLMSFVHLFSSCSILEFFLYTQIKKKNIYIYIWNEHCYIILQKEKKKSGNIHTGHADFYDTFCEIISVVLLIM